MSRPDHGIWPSIEGVYVGRTRSAGRHPTHTKDAVGAAG